MPKWCDIRALQFLDMYEKHECLWNPRIEAYKNKSARNAAFDEMLAELKIPDLTANDIKLKIKSIRTTYKRELSAVLKANSTRTKDLPAYIPKLFWFHRADSFLRSISTNRACCNTLPAKDEDCEETCSQYANKPTKYQPNENQSNALHKYKQETLQEITMALDDDDNEHETDILESTEENIIAQQRDSNHNQQIISSGVGGGGGGATITEETITLAPYRPETYEPTEHNRQYSDKGNSNRAQEDDEYSLFCRSVEAQLRSIPDSYSRSLAKFKIQQVLFEAETGHYRKTTYVTIPSVQP